MTIQASSAFLNISGEATLALDRVRYILGVLALVAYLPGLLFWFLIHPWAHSWRKLGPTLTYVIVGSTLVVVGVVVYQERRPLLGRDFGTNGAFITVGMVCFSLLGWLGFAYGRHMNHLSMSSRMGLPELSSVQRPSTFVRDGLYGIVRHPIYAYAAVAGINCALIINHVGTYILFIAALPVLYVVTLLEERELTDRFGEAYRQYQRQVPRLVPQPRKRS